MINDYHLGLLYGDGHYSCEKHLYYFSTTHQEIFACIHHQLTAQGVAHLSYQRPPQKEKWASLGIIEIRDAPFLSWLQTAGFFSDQASERISLNPSFLRGYLETSGTLFSYLYRPNGVGWRCALSGKEEDLQLMRDHFVSLGMRCTPVTQRKERETRGVVSRSFRFNMGARPSLRLLVHYLETDIDQGVSAALQNKFAQFKQFDSSFSDR